MLKRNAAANVIDLEAFRRRKMRDERPADGMHVAAAPSSMFIVPVWFCWVPMWTPFVG
jgi:hypothetical protein